MNKAEKKRLLRVRAKINKKRPHFKRFESWRYIRIKNQWRKPKGIDNKMRTEEKGWPKSVKIGYRGPSLVRGLHPSGYEEVMIWNTSDLNKIDPEIQVARIGGSVGSRKKEAILEKAKTLKIKVLNIGKQLKVDDFDYLEAEEEIIDEVNRDNDEEEYFEEDEEE